jgi:predicted protein tyrosine phosphatase
MDGCRGWSIVHACKEPYHRAALGYTSRGAPKDDPEYLIARRGPRLMLNLVDVDDPQYVRPEIFEAALDFIDNELELGTNVLVHCNQGHSRAPSIAMLWLGRRSLLPDDFEEAEAAFRRIYSDYAPRNGIRSFVEANW